MARRRESRTAGGDDLAPLDGLVERLRAADYTPAALAAMLGVRWPDDVGPLNRAAMIERLRDDSSPRAALVRLFYLECEESRRTLAAALSLPVQRDLARAGLLELRTGQAVARLRIDAVGELHLLADRRFREPDPDALALPRGDMVYPPGADSAILSQVAAELGGNEVLDLCTGSGIQALAVAARAGAVIGTDVGGRAVALAAANARVNGIRNFETRCGDLYAPIGARRFDLILGNPPFVPSPVRGPAYHGGGPRGDRVLGRLVRGLARHLRPGGRAAVISHLGLGRGEQVVDRIAPWLGGLDGRALVLLLESGSAVDLAAAQALYALDDGLDAYAREVRRWVRHLDRHDVAEIVLVLLLVERGRGSGLEVVESFQRTLPLPLSPPPADRVRRWLAA